MGFSERIEKLMDGMPVTRKMQMSDLAVKSGVNHKTLNAILKRDGKNTDYSVLKDIARALGVNVEFLMTGEGTFKEDG